MTTPKERAEVLLRLQQSGIVWHDANALRRIALTLHSWSERECGTNNGCIERDETTGKPYWVSSFTHTNGTKCRYPVPDREKGALKRLKLIMRRYSRRFHAYVQGDPRNASLYLVRRKDVPNGASIDAYYTNGIAIY